MWPSRACGVAKLRGLGKTPKPHLQLSLCLLTLPAHPVGQNRGSRSRGVDAADGKCSSRFSLLNDAYRGGGQPSWIKPEWAVGQGGVNEEQECWGSKESCLC